METALAFRGPAVTDSRPDMVLSEWVHEMWGNRRPTLFLVNGSGGSGKSTAVVRLAADILLRRPPFNDSLLVGPEQRRMHLDPQPQELTSPAAVACVSDYAFLSREDPEQQLQKLAEDLGFRIAHFIYGPPVLLVFDLDHIPTDFRPTPSYGRALLARFAMWFTSRPMFAQHAAMLVVREETCAHPDERFVRLLSGKADELSALPIDAQIVENEIRGMGIVDPSQELCDICSSPLFLRLLREYVITWGTNALQHLSQEALWERFVSGILDRELAQYAEWMQELFPMLLGRVAIFMLARDEFTVPLRELVGTALDGEPAPEPGPLQSIYRGMFELPLWSPDHQGIVENERVMVRQLLLRTALLRRGGRERDGAGQAIVGERRGTYSFRHDDLRDHFVRPLMRDASPKDLPVRVLVQFWSWLDRQRLLVLLEALAKLGGKSDSQSVQKWRMKWVVRPREESPNSFSQRSVQETIRDLDILTRAGAIVQNGDELEVGDRGMEMRDLLYKRVRATLQKVGRGTETILAPAFFTSAAKVRSEAVFARRVERVPIPMADNDRWTQRVGAGGWGDLYEWRTDMPVKLFENAENYTRYRYACWEHPVTGVRAEIPIDKMRAAVRAMDEAEGPVRRKKNKKGEYTKIGPFYLDVLQRRVRYRKWHPYTRLPCEWTSVPSMQVIDPREGRHGI